MVLHLPANVRGIMFASLIVIGLGVLGVKNNSKSKAEYDKSTGTIEYLDKTFKQLPTRHKGDFRYLKVDTYPYTFEIYEPNSKPTDKKIDDLKTGDKIDIYYYETSYTTDEGINRYTQFIDKDGQSYFIRNGFQLQLGYIVICIGLLLNVIAFGLWKIGKLKW